MNTNALKHGCCAVDTQLLANENPQDFKNLEATWLEAYNPQSKAERHLVAELINADWLLQRTTQAYLDIETRLYATAPNPLDWSEQHQRTLGRFLRYKTAHANNVAKCRKAIADYRKAGQDEKMKQERLKSFEQKNRPEPTWKEHLQNMRQQAISLGFQPPEPNPKQS